MTVLCDALPKSHPLTPTTQCNSSDSLRRSLDDGEFKQTSFGFGKTLGSDLHQSFGQVKARDLNNQIHLTYPLARFQFNCEKPRNRHALCQPQYSTKTRMNVTTRTSVESCGTQANPVFNPRAALGVLFLFVCIWGLRSLYTQPIEAGGDAIKKWIYVVNFWHGETNTLENHHTMRWAGQPSGGRCGDALATLLFLEPMMHRASTQFQPIAFGFAYLAASFWFVLAWSKQKRSATLVLSAVFLFFAYGAKAPYAYFMLGVLSFVLISGGLRAAVIWMAAFAFLFNVEAIVFNVISDRDLPLGRLSAILSTHNPDTGFNHSRYSEYFSMWMKISWFNQLISLLSMLPFAFFITTRKSKQLSPELLLLCSCLLSYHVLNTFLVVNFDTMMTPQPPEQKYLAITMPFACLASVLWIQRFLKASPQQWFETLLLIAAACLLVAHVLFDCGPRYWHNGIRYPSQTAMMFRINRHYQEGANWLEDGNLITTNYPDKVEALKVLLRPFLPSEADFIVEREDGQYLIRLADRPRKHDAQVSKYWFSQEEFLRIVPPAKADDESIAR